MPYTHEDTNYHFLDKSWSRTPKGAKHRSPLPYIMREGQLSLRGSGVSGTASQQNCVRYWTQGGSNMLFQALRNKCISKLRNKLRGDTASWGVNVLEYRETLNLLTELIGAVRHPLDTIVKTAEKAVRKGTIGSTADFIISRSINAHLAWKFGIEPLLDDIKVTSEMFNKSHRSTIYLRATARGDEDVQVNWAPFGREIGSGVHGVAAGVSLQITNYDVFLAENLGVYNLPGILADAIPLSFVVNWFYPIVTWIKNCSWLAGCSMDLQNTWCTDYVRGSSTRTINPGFEYLQNNYTGHGILVHRRVGSDAGLTLPSPPREVSYKKFMKNEGKICSAAELAAQRVISVLERVHK